MPSDRSLVLPIRFGAFLCFAGWAWHHLYWEAPYGILLWNDTTYAYAIQWGMSWEEFVGTGAADGFVQKWVARVGWLYLACTVLCLTVRKGAWIQMAFLVGGCGLLTILAYAKYLATQRQPPMFFEHGGQVLIPLLLVLALALGVRHRATVSTAMVAVILTFAGHGSYALGIWPTPASFHAMTAVILHTEYQATRSFLHVAGLLDFLVCIGILVPVFRRESAFYATIWGLLTALARPAAGMSLDLRFWGADQFVHEAFLRAPHFLVPLYLFLLWLRPRQTGSPESCLATMPSGNSTLLPTNPAPTDGQTR